MANTLRFKRGLVSGIPTALAGEPLFTTDTFDLYIGNGTGNTRFQKYIASGTTSQLLRGDGSLLTMPIVLTSPSSGQVLKYNGTNWVNDSDAGITGSGTTNYLPKFTSGSTLGNSRIFDNGTNVGIGLITPDVELAVYSASVSRFHLQNSSSGATATDGLQFAISGLDGYIWNWENGGLFFATNNTQRARITSGGNFIINNAASDNGLRFQVTGDGFFSGSVGIGTSTGLTDINLRITKALAGSVFPTSISVAGTIAQAATTGAVYVQTSAITEAAAFTLPNLYHFRSTQGTFGAGSTVTNQYGYIAESSLIGATNNFGFYGNIASGTGRWNLYMNGTANNYINGNLGIGTTTIERKLHVVGDVLVAGISSGIYFKDNTNTPFLWVQDAYGLRFGTNNTERMRLDVSGNLGLGVTPSAWSSTRAIQVGLSGSIANRSGGNGFYISSNLYFSADPSNTAANGVYINSDFATTYLQANGAHRWYNAPSGTAGNAITFTQAMTLFATGNLAVGTTTDAGYKLDVNGTMRVSGTSTFGGLATISTSVYPTLAVISSNSIGSGMYLRATGTSGGYFTILSTASGAGQGAGKFVIVDELASATRFTIDSTGAATFSSSVTAGGNITLSTNNTYIYGKDNVGNTPRLLGINSGNSTYIGPIDAYAGGEILYAVSTNVTNQRFYTSGSERMRITSGGSTILAYSGPDTGELFQVYGTMKVTGAATFSSSVQAATAISIGTTPDTNKPFKILKNINGTVGINFENTSTGSLAFSAIQMGTDVSGGTKFTNLVYASSGVTASGVYNPDGTSLINNGSGGLNFLGTPIRFYTGGSNGVLRYLFDNEGAIQYTTTAPTTNAVDGYKQYSADVVAGNAAPHFRTENGAVIKLYQETTAVGNAIFSQGGGNSVLDDSTFDGYTLRQIVRALRNQGILQ